MNRNWLSSYEKNNYGELFYSIIRIYQPKKVVELGTKAGYSAYHIARGLRANERSSSSKVKGTLDCYDLWEDYHFNSVPKTQAEENLREFSGIVRLNHQDAIGAERNYNKIDILHVDLSNEGAVLEATIPHWIDKVTQLVIIEGGSIERDQIPWMMKYKKKSIIKWLKDFARSHGGIEYLTIEPFPSITIIKKHQK